jgi:uncharacterized cupredoxin-like copper-binding protein
VVSVRRSFVLLCVVLGLVAVGCGGDNGGGSTGETGGATGGTATGATSTTGGGGATVDVTEKDFAIALGQDSASSGDLTFDITNDGPSVHEFVIFKTDLAPDALPTKDDGTVDEEGEGVTHIDEVEDINPNTNASLDVSLDPGNYVFICNLPGHYQAGMHVAFTVS